MHAVGMLLLQLAACGPGAPTPEPTDILADVPSETPAEVAPEASPEVAPEAGPDVALDVGPEVPLDAGPDGPPDAGPVGPCSCAVSLECPEQHLVAAGHVLAVVEESDHYVAYEAPSGFAQSLAWADGRLWVSDLMTGRIYETAPAPGGLEVLRAVTVPPDPYRQARDLTWDGQNLWSLNWGDVIRHDMDDPHLTPDVWITEGEIGSPNLHHMKGLAWDGERLWSALNGALYRHDPQTFAVAQAFPLPAEVGSPAGMAFAADGRLWFASRSGGFVREHDLESHEVVGTWSLVAQPFGLTWGEDLWLYDWLTRRIYRFHTLPAPGESLHPDDAFLPPDAAPTMAEPPQIDTVWDLAGSPYLVESGIAVPAGVTLTIEAGVEVYFTHQATLEVAGTLRVLGEPDAPVLLTHSAPGELWGTLYFAGPGANQSELRHAIVQYAQDSIKGVDGMPHLVEGCVVRRGGLDALLFELGPGEYEPLVVAGNVLGESAAAAVVVTLLSPDAHVPSIDVRENAIAHTYSQVILQTDAGIVLAQPPAMTVAHNLFEHGFRGVGAGTPIAGGLVFSDNYLDASPSGSGVQPFGAGNVITRNLIRHTHESGYQLHPSHAVDDTIFEHNTVIGAGYDTDWGNPTVLVRYNNLVPASFSQATRWIDAPQEDTAIRSNWWGTTDVDLIREHIFDGYWQRAHEPGPPTLGHVEIDPILSEPNGVGFVLGRVVSADTGRPLSRAPVSVGPRQLQTAANGRFFSSADEGSVLVTATAPGHATTTMEVHVCSGEAAEVVLELEP